MPGKSVKDGAPVGSGRPKKQRKSIKIKGETPLDVLLDVMKNKKADPALRVRAAIAAAQYTHTKLHDGGKKEEKETAAERAGSGKFAPAAPPKLVINNR